MLRELPVDGYLSLVNGFPFSCETCNSSRYYEGRDYYFLGDDSFSSGHWLKTDLLLFNVFRDWSLLLNWLRLARLCSLSLYTLQLLVCSFLLGLIS